MVGAVPVLIIHEEVVLYPSKQQQRQVAHSDKLLQQQKHLLLLIPLLLLSLLLTLGSFSCCHNNQHLLLPRCGLLSVQGFSPLDPTYRHHHHRQFIGSNLAAATKRIHFMSLQSLNNNNTDDSLPTTSSSSSSSSSSTTIPTTNMENRNTSRNAVSATTSKPQPLIQQNAMRLIQGLQEIVNDYDIFFIDMWGVLHNGQQPYDHVLHAIQQLTTTTRQPQHDTDDSKIRLLLLSNSSQRYQNSVVKLQQLGFDLTDFHSIITSGEVTFQLILLSSSSSSATSLQNDCDGSGDVDVATVGTVDISPSTTTMVGMEIWEPLRSIISSTSSRNEDAISNNKEEEKKHMTKKKNVFVLGSGDDDDSYCTSCGWTPVSNIEDAHLIVARGPFTIPTATSVVDTSDRGCPYPVIDRRVDGEEVYQQTLHQVLQIAAQLFLPMIVSNPDKVRPDMDRSPMPGQIGDLYESILTEQQRKDSHASSNVPSSSLVKRIGKPFPDVYEIALQRISDVVVHDKSRICMIGDALETDIVGGTLFGIDTIWVLQNGVHKLDVQKYMEDTDMNLLQSATQLLDDFNNNNVGTYAEGLTLSPTIVMPYFKW